MWTFSLIMERKSYTSEDYILTELEQKLILAIAHQDNYFPTPIGKTSDGKENIHIQTLDARKATKAVSKLLKELKIIQL